MIVVKIEIWPRGIRSKAREIGRVVIANDGTGTSSHGNYVAALSHAGVFSHRPGAWKGARVVGHARTLSPYHLVRAAINACLGAGWPKEADKKLVDMTRDGAQTPGEEALAKCGGGK